MKKIIAIAIVIALLFSMTACGGGELPVYATNWGKNDVSETSEYTIKVTLNDKVLDENAPRLFGEGKYVTSIKGGSGSGYEITTKLTFKGDYELSDGTKVPVDDVVTSSVTFKDLMFDFKPIKSEKNYKGKTIKFLDGKYSIEDLTYTSSIEYGEKKSAVKNNVNGESSTFELSNPSGMFIDNEQLFYLVRSFVKKDGAGISFNLTSGMSSAAVPMAATVTANGVAELSTNINGHAQTLKAFPVTVRKNANSETGTTQLLYCIKDDKGDVNNETGGKISVDRSRVVKIIQSVPYTMDVFEYDLVKYTYGE
ncbi:MAG: hypothetical protein RR107_01025 [Clostridia bacterium]